MDIICGPSPHQSLDMGLRTYGFPPMYVDVSACFTPCAASHIPALMCSVALQPLNRWISYVALHHISHWTWDFVPMDFHPCMWMSVRASPTVLHHTYLH